LTGDEDSLGVPINNNKWTLDEDDFDATTDEEEFSSSDDEIFIIDNPNTDINEGAQFDEKKSFMDSSFRQWRRV